jgi:hypothetical protein
MTDASGQLRQRRDRPGVRRRLLDQEAVLGGQPPGEPGVAQALDVGEHLLALQELTEAHAPAEHLLAALEVESGPPAAAARDRCPVKISDSNRSATCGWAASRSSTHVVPERM